MAGVLARQEGKAHVFYLGVRAIHQILDEDARQNKSSFLAIQRTATQHSVRVYRFPHLRTYARRYPRLNEQRTVSDNNMSLS